MAIRKRNGEPGATLSSHADSIIKDAHKELKDPARRLLGKRILSLGGLALLSGCDLSSDKSVNTMLRRISFFNDDVQALLFDPNKMAPTYPESMITRPFPFNASPTRALGNPRADPRQHIKFILFNAHLGELFRYRISG
jgi:hypothetical protein